MYHGLSSSIIFRNLVLTDLVGLNLISKQILLQVLYKMLFSIEGHPTPEAGLRALHIDLQARSQ